MTGAEDVPVGVNLEEVAVLGVEPEAPDGELGVVIEVLDGGGVAHRYQTLLDHLEAEDLVGWRFVLGQRVVHVEAIELDLLQVEAPIDKNPEKIELNVCFISTKVVS